jgi:hypothetical protein
MSKALTPRNPKFKGKIDPGSPQLSDEKFGGLFPSYFGNFGFLNRLLMLRMQARVIKRRFLQGHAFPLITAIMAIV